MEWSSWMKTEQRLCDERCVNKGKAYVQTIEGTVPWKHEKRQMGVTGAHYRMENVIDNPTRGSRNCYRALRSTVHWKQVASLRYSK